MERTINIDINGQFVRKDNKNAGVMGEVNVATLHITCDDSWRGYGKRIVWRDVNGENPVSVILFETDSAPADPLIYDTTIPAEPMALPGWCSFTIEGYNEVDGVHKVAMSVSDHLYVEQSDSYYKPAEPTPSQTQQILEALGETEESVKKIATEAKSWAVGGTGTREGEDNDNSKYYALEAKKSATAAAQSAGMAKDSEIAASKSENASLDNANKAEKSASYAAKEAKKSADEAIKSESWAVGGTGTRPGENSNNANYWANVSQAEADRATIPAVDGVYNVILSDQVTLEKYALKVENGSFFVIGVSSSFKATDMTFVDQSTGLSYFLFVESGELFIKEIE